MESDQTKEVLTAMKDLANLWPERGGMFTASEIESRILINRVGSIGDAVGDLLDKLDPDFEVKK